MIEIIKEPKKYEISCGDDCGCRFRFTKGDVKDSGNYSEYLYVVCPCCGEKLHINRLSNYEVKENKKDIE